MLLGCCVCAGVIAATTAAERSGFDTYHVVNPHWNDGISLDRIVDWVESAGYPVSLPPLHQSTLSFELPSLPSVTMSPSLQQVERTMHSNCPYLLECT